MSRESAMEAYESSIRRKHILAEHQREDGVANLQYQCLHDMRLTLKPTSLVTVFSYMFMYCPLQGSAKKQHVSKKVPQNLPTHPDKTLDDNSIAFCTSSLKSN